MAASHQILAVLATCTVFLIGFEYLANLPPDIRSSIVFYVFAIACGIALVRFLLWVKSDVEGAVGTLLGLIGLSILCGVVYLFFRLLGAVFEAVVAWFFEFWPWLSALAVATTVAYLAGRK